MFFTGGTGACCPFLFFGNSDCGKRLKSFLFFLVFHQESDWKKQKTVLYLNGVFSKGTWSFSIRFVPFD